LRRVDARLDPLAPGERIVDDDDDRVEALRGSPRRCATPTRELGKLGLKVRMQTVDKPGAKATALALCQAEPIVARDRDVNPSAHERPVAVCPADCLTSLAS